jgi:hypothetical protein
MPEVVDSFTFDKGINIKKNPTALSDGELQTCSGFAFTKDAQLSPMLPRSSVGNTQLGEIRNIHRYINYVYVQEGSNIKYKWDLDGYCDLYTPSNASFTQVVATEAKRCRIADYKTWTFMVNGFKNFALNGSRAYDWQIQNPTSAPTGATGSGSNPNGTYTLYYTFLIKFPNGEMYETGPSASSDVTVTTSGIAWSNIGTSTYIGEGVIIWRRLYRYSTTLGSAFWVVDIEDNTTTTYTDDFADATINVNDVLTSTEYGPPPDDLIAVETYLQRLFAVKDNYLYWSEPYLPFSFKQSSGIVVTSEGDKLVGCKFWGDTLYMPSKAGWHRLAGSDPDTWAVKEVFSDRGIINPDTVEKTKYGIVGLWYDGIYLFDGSTSRNITEKVIGTSLFTTTIGVLNYASCWATYDGSHYEFHYPNACLIIDFYLYPEIRFYHDPLLLTAHEYHDATGIRYMGYNGYQYEMGTTGTAITLTLLTGEKVGQNILQRKNLKYLYYDIDTGSINVTATIYIDGVAQSPTFTLNTSTRTRDRIDFPNFEGYRISIGLSCASITGLKPIVYAPWAIQSTTVGV